MSKNIIESVANMSYIPILMIRKALIAPISIPTIRGTITAGTAPKPQITMNFAAITAANPATAPTERSKPSIVREIVIASPMSATMETDLKILVTLLKLRKLSNVKELNKGK